MEWTGNRTLVIFAYWDCKNFSVNITSYLRWSRSWVCRHKELSIVESDISALVLDVLGPRTTWSWRWPVSLALYWTTLRRRALGLPQLVHCQIAKKFSFPSALLRQFLCCFWFWFFIVSFGFVRGKGITSKNLQVLDCVPRAIFK